MRPTSSAIAPVRMSGPVHGFELSSGQVSETSDGAGSLPFETAITDMSAGILIEKSLAWSNANCCSQRSEPAGFGTVLVLPACSFDCSWPVDLLRLTSL